MQETYYYKNFSGHWEPTTRASYERMKAWGGPVRLGSEGVPKKSRKKDTFEGGFVSAKKNREIYAAKLKKRATGDQRAKAC